MKALLLIGFRGEVPRPVTAAGVEGDPQVATLKERFNKACPGKP